MNQKMMIVLSTLMIGLNALVFIYGDRYMKIDVSVYVVQVGRYQDKTNSETICQQLADNGFEAYQYQDQDIVVIAGILTNHDQAKTLATQISEKAIGCVVKEYLVNQNLLEDINNKKYDDVYKELT